MNILQLFTVLGFGFFVGARHGIDIDHIAAIFDFTSSQKDKKRGFLLSILYILGHATIVILLGFVLLFLGYTIPKSWENILGDVIGVTLIFLGIYVLYSVVTLREQFKIKSRWLLFISGLFYFYHAIVHVFHRQHIHLEKAHVQKYEKKTSFLIGVLHGIGVETPTQILAFATLLQLKGVLGILFLTSFVIGIFTSHIGISLLSTRGYMFAWENKKVYLFVGIATAFFSIMTGFFLIFITL